jgi:hypothetical protein
LELNNPRVLISNFAGLTASNVTTIRDACRRAGSPLVVVTPGVDASLLQLLSKGDLAAIQATDLSGQPVDNLLADLAIVAGGTELRTELGFGLAFPQSLSKIKMAAAGLESQASAEPNVDETLPSPPSRPAGSSGFIPPTIDALASKFPQLDWKSSNCWAAAAWGPCPKPGRTNGTGWWP